MASRRSVGYNGEEDRGGDKRKKKQAYVPLFAWIKGKVFWQARELQTVNPLTRFTSQIYVSSTESKTWNLFVNSYDLFCKIDN